MPKSHNGFYLLYTYLLKQSIISAYEIRENRSYNHNTQNQPQDFYFLWLFKKKKNLFSAEWAFSPGVSITLHSHPPTCLPSVTQWPHPIHRKKNPVPSVQATQLWWSPLSSASSRPSYCGRCCLAIWTRSEHRLLLLLNVEAWKLSAKSEQ